MEKIKSKACKPTELSKIDMPARPSLVVSWRGTGVLQFGLILFFCVELLETAVPRDAVAYVDPGTTGLLSQMLYVLFYAALGGFFYFMRTIRRSIGTVKQRIAKLCGLPTKNLPPRDL